MKSKYKSAILQMLLEGRGDANSLCDLPDYFYRKDSKLSDLEEQFKDKVKKFPELEQLHNEILAELHEHLSSETDYYYTEGFRFGVLLGLDVAGFIKEE